MGIFNMKKVNICVGRFQPFTAGHYKCIEAARKANGLQTVICMINVPANRVDKRHPFVTTKLVSAYDKLFKGDSNIADVVSVTSADIVKIGEQLKSAGYEIASWTCGTDRLDAYTRMSTKYHDAAGLSDDFEMIEVPRTDEDIIATKARTCLLNDDKDGFSSLMPEGTDTDKLFKALKAQIDKVYKDKSERLVIKYKKLVIEKRLSRLENLIKYS